MAKLAWQRWNNDPVEIATGISFDRTPAGEIRAPPGMVRVCAYHIDFDERPTCYVDLANRDEVDRIVNNLSKLCRFNVDYAIAYDDAGRPLNAPPY